MTKDYLICYARLIGFQQPIGKPAQGKLRKQQLDVQRKQKKVGGK